MSRASKPDSLRRDLAYLISRGDGEHMIDDLAYTIDFAKWPQARQLAVLVAIAQNAPTRDAAAFRKRAKKAVAQNRAGDLIREIAALLELDEGGVSSAVIALENAKRNNSINRAPGKPTLAIVKGAA